MTTQLYIVNVEGAILRDGRYLMIVRGAEEEYAAGVLALVGGKVEATENAKDVLEDTLRREIMEEVGVQVGDLAYVHSTQFIVEDGAMVVDIVFLCAYQWGEPRIDDPGEVADILWMSAEDVMQHPKAMPWLQDSIQQVEAVRCKLQW